MVLSFKRSTHFYDKEDALKMYNHYINYIQLYDDDDDYIDYLKLCDDEGELINEYKKFE